LEQSLFAFNHLPKKKRTPDDNLTVCPEI